jgi:hypothetical protein
MSVAASLLEKAPAEILPYTFDFSNWVAIVGASFSSANIAASPSGDLVLGAASISGLKVTFQISGGVAGKVYELTVSALTAGGYEAQAFAKLSVSLPPGF